MNDVCFDTLLFEITRSRYKTHFKRVENHPEILVAFTDGLTSIGIKEIKTISRSPFRSSASLLIEAMVKRILETDQSVGVRKDILFHPKSKIPIRVLVANDLLDDVYLDIFTPDRYGRLPGEHGYIDVITKK